MPLCTKRFTLALVGYGGASFGGLSRPHDRACRIPKSCPRGGAVMLGQQLADLSRMPPPVTPKTPPSFLAMPELQARRQLNAALGQLSPLQRQLVLTHLRTGDDAERLAARLGLARDSARASLSFAVAQLRMALSDAPLDKTREDWLQRCRTLLEAARPVQKTPTHEVDLPSSWSTVELEPIAALKPEIVPNAAFLVVETRSPTPAPRPEIAVPVPTSDPRVPRASEATAATPIARPSPPARPVASAPMRHRPAQTVPRRWPWLAAVAAALVMAIIGWQITSSPKDVAPPKPAQPQRVPALSEPAAPLTAADFQLVLLRQQHEGVLEDLDFYLWLSEQEAAR